MKQIVVTLDRPEIRKVEDSGDIEKVAEVRVGPPQGLETAPPLQRSLGPGLVLASLCGLPLCGK